MKKREFLAMGGAVPLMLAGCGGNGGSANVRLVNASSAYPLLGFEVGTTQATSADVAYGNASPFESVDSGSQSTTLTTTDSGAITGVLTTTRTLSKGSRYSLVAYGTDTLASVLINENQDTPDSGYASFNVLNTSTVALDVYLTTTTATTATPASTDLLISSSFGNSTFHTKSANTYLITVTASGNKSDVRLVIPGVVLSNQQILTLILSPAASGALMNGILLTQATDGTVTAEPNTSARVRAIVSLGSGLTATVSPQTVTATSPVIVTNSPAVNWTPYKMVDTSSVMTVTVSDGSTTQAVTVSPSLTSLTAGNDYTVLVYGQTLATAVATLLVDDNSLPSTSNTIRIAMLNAVVNGGNDFPLTLVFNNNVVSQALPVDSISDFTNVAVSTLQTTTSQLIIRNNVLTLQTLSNQQVTIGKTYLVVVQGVYDSTAASTGYGLTVTFQTTGT